VEPFRLKLKIGPHEFEAEGAQETVERQFAVWRELIASPSASAQPPISAPPAAGPASPPPAVPSLIVSAMTDDIPRPHYDRLFRHEGRVVSLTILPTGADREANAALLLLLGQQVYNAEALVSGGDILQGLQRSGIPVQRADRVFGGHMDTNVIRVGQHRAVKYRLTTLGLPLARQLAKELLTMVP